MALKLVSVAPSPEMRNTTTAATWRTLATAGGMVGMRSPLPRDRVRRGHALGDRPRRDGRRGGGGQRGHRDGSGRGAVGRDRRHEARVAADVRLEVPAQGDDVLVILLLGGLGLDENRGE